MFIKLKYKVNYKHKYFLHYHHLLYLMNFNNNYSKNYIYYDFRLVDRNDNIVWVEFDRMILLIFGVCWWWRRRKHYHCLTKWTRQSTTSRVWRQRWRWHRRRKLVCCLDVRDWNLFKQLGKVNRSVNLVKKMLIT